MTDTSALVQSLQNAAHSWQSFDWTAKRAEQDTTLQQCQQAREQSLTARKQLADTTKQFKRSVKTVEQASSQLAASASPETVNTTVKAVEGLAKECRVTVKSYQEEIDKLTRRCKTSEGAYGQLCQDLEQVPDPAAVLQAAMEHMTEQQAQMSQLLQTVEQVNQELQASEQQVQQYKKQASSSKKDSGMSKQGREELVQLRREVAEYEVEFRSLKNQDITIRKLEAKIAEMQTAGEEALKEQLEKTQQELAETEGRRAAEALEREAAMEAKVQTLELQLQAERAGREATQEHWLEADEGVSQREAAWEAQRRILVDDAERVRESLQTAMRERDELRLRVAALEEHKSGPTSPPSGGLSTADLMLERKAYEAEVAELSETSVMLRDELRSKEEAMVEERRNFEKKVDALEREKTILNSNLTSLETQLAAAPSQVVVDSMKRELRILKRLEYNADDVDTDRDPEIAGGNGDEEKDLETVLVGKLRRAESDLVTERISRTDLVKQCDELKESLAEAERAKEEAEKLVASLEKDLERAIATPAETKVASRKSSDIVVPTEENPATLQHILDPDAPSPPPPPASPSPKVTKTATEKAEDDHSVATIVMAQRDRLRARCEALEAERDSFKRELQGQVQASESLKADNTKLYEKVRYMSSRGAHSRPMADRDLDLEALEQRYEASVDPFRQFSKAERQRKLGEMSPMERTVFMVAKTVLATKEMRTGLFFYVLAMHLLVFITTYHWSHADGCLNVNNEHLAHLPPALPAHIQEQMAAKAGEAVAAVADAATGGT